MGQYKLASTTEIDKEFESLISKCDNEKLLTIDSAEAINLILIVHPSPRNLVKLVITRRRVEDMILISLTLPRVGKYLLASRPKLKELDIAKRILGISRMLGEESVEFANYAKLELNREQQIKLANAAADVSRAYAEEGFDAPKYFLKHKDAMSLWMDGYLIANLFTTSTSNNFSREELETAMHWLWGLRELMAIYSAREQKYR